MMVQDGHEERKNLLQTKVVLVGSRYFRAMGVYAKHLHDINKISIVEPFYEGTISHLVLDSVDLKPVSILNIGIPRKFLTNYGKFKDHDEFLKIQRGAVCQNLWKWVSWEEEAFSNR